MENISAKKGITLLSLAITIIIILILAGITLGAFLSNNGLINKTKESNFNNAVSELYERSDSEISYLRINDRIRLSGGVSLDRVYSSKGFKEHYEIRGEYIYDKARGIDLVKKKEYEEYIENKLKKDGENNESEEPSVTAITNEDTKITGTGKKGSDIIVSIGTNTYTGKVDNNGDFSITIPKQPSGTIIKVSQKEEGKNESEKIPVEVYKTRLGKITIDNVVNTDTKITGKAKPKADVKLVINGREYTGKADDTGKFDIQVSSLSDGDVVKGTQSFGDKITSEEEKVTVGIGKGQKPLVNEVTTEDTAVTGKADPKAKIRVILEDDTEYIGFADESRKL